MVVGLLEAVEIIDMRLMRIENSKGQAFKSSKCEDLGSSGYSTSNHGLPNLLWGTTRQHTTPRMPGVDVIANYFWVWRL